MESTTTVSAQPHFPFKGNKISKTKKKEWVEKVSEVWREKKERERERERETEREREREWVGERIQILVSFRKKNYRVFIKYQNIFRTLTSLGFHSMMSVCVHNGR